MSRQQRRLRSLEQMETRRLPATISVSPVTVYETGPAIQAVFTATLDQALTEPVTLSYATSDGSARAGRQYSATDSTVTIPAGATSATFSVPILADYVAGNATEKFTVSLSAGSGNTVAAKKVTAKIVDAVAEPTVTATDVVVPTVSGKTRTSVVVSLSNPSAKAVKVSYATLDDSATSSGSGAEYRSSRGTVTIPAGTTSVKIPLTITSSSATDAVFDVALRAATNAQLSTTGAASRYARVVVEGTGSTAKPVLTVSSPFVAAGQLAVFDVSLSSASASPVSVRYEFANPAASGSLVSGVLTIPSGQTTAAIVAPTVASSGVQLLTLNLSAPANATLASAGATAVILGADTDPSVSVSSPTVAASSTGTATETFTVSLSAASPLPVTVNYGTFDGSAAAGTAYTATSGTLTFAPGVTSLTVPVTVLAQATAVASEEFGLALSNPVNAVEATFLGYGTITNAAAVTTPTGPTAPTGPGGSTTTTTSGPSLTVTGGNVGVGTTGTATLAFTVSLSAASTTSVTVAYATADGSAVAGTDYTATSGTLTFAPGVTSQTVDVTVAGEATSASSKTVGLDLTGGTNTANASASAEGTIVYVVPGATDDLSDDLSDASAGVETATGSTEVAASFGTPASSYTLDSVTLQLAQEAAGGTATVAIYSDGGQQPGTLVGTLTASSALSTTLGPVTFTSSGITLAANSTYWVVLVAPTGSVDWSWTADDTGTGSGFQDAWAETSDAGTTWFAYDSSPTQMSVKATVSAAG